MVKRSQVIVNEQPWRDFRKVIIGFRGGPIVEVGVSEEEKYPNGKSVAAVAGQNEFGTDRIPPRPFMRETFDNKIAVIRALKRRLLRKGFGGRFLKVSKSKRARLRVAKELGRAFMIEVRKTIINFRTPPNSFHTIRRKGRNDPLVDTFHMHNSIGWKVRSSKFGRTLARGKR